MEAYICMYACMYVYMYVCLYCMGVCMCFSLDKRYCMHVQT